MNHHNRKQLLLLLSTAWTITIIWAEYYYFNRLIVNCQWPTTTTNFHLLIIADPQLPATHYSYPNRILPLRWISIKIINQFIRKAWRLLIKELKPHAIVFLGDLLDGGIATNDHNTFQAYLNQFYHTFSVPPHILKTKSNQIHLVGNHDVGLYPSTTREQSALARQRFIKHWPPGKLNGLIEWANHTIIWIDALSLIEESKNQATGLLPHGEGEVTQFINELTGPEMLLPKVLFTHVPLWRPEGTSCGPLRESRREIHQGAGINYQNEIPQEASKMILEKIQPSLVFSGDDHDYCQVVHTLPSTSLANPSPLSIQEISVKSFSMGMGVQEPGYHLLSLSNPARFGRAPDEQTTFHRPCLLPNQIWIYTHVYLPLLILTLLMLFGPPVIWKVMQSSRTGRRAQAKTNGLPIHHRTHRHRKSLSRTLMFTTTTTNNTSNNNNKSSGSISSSSSSSSSDENGRSDEEEPHDGSRLVGPHRARRSASLGLAIGLGIDQGDGFHSPTAMLSYHSPLDSGHHDARFSHPSPVTPTDSSGHKFRRSVELNEAPITDASYPPHHHQHYGRSLSSRFQSSSSIPNPPNSNLPIILRPLRLLLGRKLTDQILRFFSPSSVGPHSLAALHLNHQRLLCRRRRRRSPKQGPFWTALHDLLRLLSLIAFLYLLILLWFLF